MSCRHEQKLTAGDFSQLVPYRIGNYWGFSDTLKHIVIPVKYDDVEIINDTMARVKSKNIIRFINTAEKEIFPFPYFL